MKVLSSLRSGAVLVARRDRSVRRTSVRLLIHGDDVLVASLDSGEILGEFTIDPARGYQAKKKGPGENQGPSS